jgi:hypothetical protein
MSPVQMAFLIVAAILFIIAAVWPALQPHPWAPSLVPLGLFFATLAFLIPALGA